MEEMFSLLKLFVVMLKFTSCEVLARYQMPCELELLSGTGNRESGIQVTY